MSESKVIAIGGENLIDQVHTTSEDGARSFVNNPGGSPFNVAVAIARQGQEAHYLTPISTDEMGDLLAARLDKDGVHIASARRSEPTTMAIVTVTDGIPSYEFKRDGTAERCVTEASLAAVMPSDAAAFHIGSLALAGGDDAGVWESVFHTAAKAGVFTSLDPNVRPSLIEDAEAYRARLERLFETADLIKLSDEDLEWIYPDLDLTDGLSRLRAVANASLIVLTKGADGAEGATKHHHVRIEAPKVTEMGDTIGAGDTFMGTLLATLAAQDALSADAINGFDADDLRALIARAAQAAALNCAQKGCNPPSLSVLDAAMA